MMPGRTLASRGSIHYARNALQDLGYKTERITGSDRQFDLIAWKKDNHTPLFVIVRTTRVPGIARFSYEVLKLSLMVQRNEIPGQLQIWLYHTGGVSRYQILSGGAILITGRIL